jgi:hypothetical protein
MEEWNEEDGGRVWYFLDRGNWTFYLSVKISGAAAPD